MWKRSRRSPKQCSVQDIHHQSQYSDAAVAHLQSPSAGLYGRCCSPCQTMPSSSHHQVHLQFPSPPNYPYSPSVSFRSSPSPNKMSSDEHYLLGSPAGPSTQQQQQPFQQQQQQQQQWDMPSDYSYAYYVPGPPTRHANVPNKGCRAYREGSYRSRHTYLTHYGTEENIYEEISEVARARLRPLHHHHHHHESMVSISQNLVEEEVRRVQSGHHRMLGELNLSVEAMLMPPSSSREGSDETEMEGEIEDQLADLMTIGPTDELLSPTPVVDHDSGFSGSSSGASYRSAGGSLRKGTAILTVKERAPSSASLRSAASSKSSPNKKFWNKKAWKRLTGFPSTRSFHRKSDEPRGRPGTWEGSTCDHRRITSPVEAIHTSQHTISQRSSEDSWCSGSEPELSTDEESERSASSSNRSNGQLRNTLNKAKTLCDKFRGSGGIGSTNRLSFDGVVQRDSPRTPSSSNQSRLSRWFSIRRGSTHQYDVESVDDPGSPQSPNAMPLLSEVEEENVFANYTSQCRRQIPPTLPPAPENLNPQQIKRRLIVSAIVHSENSYVAALQRLVNDYKKPLEESSPSILSSTKISTLFFRLPEILQCHTLFRIALAESVRNWDRDEKIGDVFIASFSKAIVLDIYSGFINNFSIAMDLAKMEAKRKSALADFFKVKQISSHDRLSFFGLIVKPVQRFPQFILFLQDLLKHTPQGHHDRMSLQLALTQLESLAEMLNERKRESEQYQAFKGMLRHISGKFSVRPLSDSNRYLLREDNVMQLEYNQNGVITKAKNRRLLLLNDLVICVSVTTKSSSDFGSNDRLNLKWAFPVSEVEIQDTSASPTLSRVVMAGLGKRSSIKSNSSFDGTPPQEANNLCSDMSNLMHDYEVMSRICDLIGSLHGTYDTVSLENTRRTLLQIQTSVQRKDEEMAWVDSCCLQLVVKVKGKDEIFTFKTNNPSIKKEWITELRLAQLALDPNNSPAWEIPEQEQRPSTKMPLFVKSQCVYRSQHQTEVRCGCYYTVMNSSKISRRNRLQNYLWVCTTDDASSHITILAQHHQQAGQLKDVRSFSLIETKVTAMEFVKGLNVPCPLLASDSVWMGTDSHRLLLYAATDPEKREEIGSVTVSDAVVQIKCHYDSVFVALANGTLNIYRRNAADGSWMLKEPQTLALGTDSVSSLLPINMCLYAACGKKVWVLNGITGEVQKSFSVQHEHIGNVNLMAHSGIGLWISLKYSSTICLYHTETFKHLQDINIASNVVRVTNPPSGSRDCMNNNNRSQVNVTALLACKGLLWVGTNVGITLTIPLPRLEGVPIISGRVNISYHAHFGPISFLLALQPKSYNNFKNALPTDLIEEVPKSETESHGSETQITETDKYFTSSPIVPRKRRTKGCARLSKTLPRRFGNNGSIFSTGSTTSSQGSGDTCDVYGLYGELMYVKDCEGEESNLTDPVYESLRRSDPELAAIPNKVSTLDRRLKMKVSRPRSLDLSNWSVDSRSSSLCTSSGSEECMRLNVSRNNSNASRQLMEQGNKAQEAEEKSSQMAVTHSTIATKAANKNNGVDSTRRTIITLMGGRGYVNFRQPCCSADKSKSSFSIKESNRNDAHIVVWELKL